MLCLNLKAGERVFFRGEFEGFVRVTRVERGKVFLAFDLPRAVGIVREKAEERRKRESEGQGE